MQSKHLGVLVKVVMTIAHKLDRLHRTAKNAFSFVREPIEILIIALFTYLSKAHCDTSEIMTLTVPQFIVHQFQMTEYSHFDKFMSVVRLLELIWGQK